MAEVEKITGRVVQKYACFMKTKTHVSKKKSFFGFLATVFNFKRHV